MKKPSRKRNKRPASYSDACERELRYKRYKKARKARIKSGKIKRKLTDLTQQQDD